jgi:uncharacterized membrane protein YeaQ/YmgE (transglycosylase-associated protein family)
MIAGQSIYFSILAGLVGAVLGRVVHSSTAGGTITGCLITVLLICIYDYLE